MKISVSLPDELAARVDALRRPGVGRSKVIQELLEEALEPTLKPPLKPLPVDIPGVVRGSQVAPPEQSEYVSDEEGS